MTGYIVREYEEIETNLAPFLEEHDLDKVTVSSLIHGSIEILEDEIPKASIAIIDENKLTSGISVKIKNIKINFKFALNSIFSFRPVYNSKGIWLVLSILKVITFLLEEMKIDLDKNDAVVVFCLYRLHEADIEKIMEYVKRLNGIENDIDMKRSQVEDSLKKLETIETIELRNGKYYICETVFVKKTFAVN